MPSFQPLRGPFWLLGGALRKRGSSKMVMWRSAHRFLMFFVMILGTLFECVVAPKVRISFFIRGGVEVVFFFELNSGRRGS